MANPQSHDDALPAVPSHDELRHELKRRGLPRAYIERLLSELDDHFVDLLEERNSPMGAARKLQFEESGTHDLQQRLGEPTHLALFAAEQYHARSFWGRHPIVTFLLAPVPLFVASYIGFGFALTALIYLGMFVMESVLHVALPNVHAYPMLKAVLAGLLGWYICVVPPLAVAVVLCRAYSPECAPPVVAHLGMRDLGARRRHPRSGLSTHGRSEQEFHGVLRVHFQQVGKLDSAELSTEVRRSLRHRPVAYQADAAEVHGQRCAECGFGDWITTNGLRRCGRQQH